MYCCLYLIYRTVLISLAELLVLNCLLDVFNNGCFIPPEQWTTVDVFNNGCFIPPVQLLDMFNNGCFIPPVQLWADREHSPHQTSSVHGSWRKNGLVISTSIHIHQQSWAWDIYSTYTVRKCNWWRFCLALCDEIFDHFPLFDKTLRNIELCNSVISHKTAKSAKTSLTLQLLHTCSCCQGTGASRAWSRYTRWAGPPRPGRPGTGPDPWQPGAPGPEPQIGRDLNYVETILSLNWTPQKHSCSEFWAQN